MRIGYACITLGIDKKYRTCRLKNATDDNLYEIINHNLNLLEEVIEYNYQNNISLFRISSDLIPFASKPEVMYDWQKVFKQRLKEIGKKIKKYNIRVSMHPGQYAILNSPHQDVVTKTILDLRYHTDFLNLLGVDNTSKIILHVGGVYGDKEQAILRFINSYQLLDRDIKARLVIENDEKNYNIKDILQISYQTKIPVVLDILHHQINGNNDNIINIIKKVIKTWKTEDGVCKMHYSQQAKVQRIGAHSQTIDIDEFLVFYKKIKNLNIDIMLEVKDKDLSAIKCIKVIERIRKSGIY